jgi:HK97 family phage prohead protease
MELTIRQFDDVTLRVADDDGLTVEGLVVPYNREIQAVDIRPSGVLRYREVFRSGACARAIKAPNRTLLTYTHDESLPQRLGYGIAFREAPEGLWGAFRLDPSTAAKARDVLTTTHTAFSVGFASFVPRAGTEQAGTLVERSSVALLHVAAVPAGQYADAGVRAIREQELAEALDAESQAVEKAVQKANADALAEIDALIASQRAIEERFGIARP